MLVAFAGVVIVGMSTGIVVCAERLSGGVSISISIDTWGTGVSGDSELGGEDEVFDLGRSGIVDGEDEEDVDDELEDVEDIDDEEVPVEVSDVVDNGSDTSRCW